MTSSQHRPRRRVRARALLVVLAMVAAGFVGVAAPSSAEVSEVEGSAFGYASEVSLFGGPKNRRGFGQTTTAGCNVQDPACAPETAESPSVELPATGGNVSDTDPDGATAQYGPAIIFSSGAQETTSQGTTGAGGSVTTTASITTINASQQEVFTADRASSTVTASETGVSGTTTIVNGTVITSEGDPNVDGDETIVAVPTNPPVNHVIPGQIEGVGDRFEYVFNEHVPNADGSLTVYAGHLRLLGPTAVGDLYIAKSTSGVTSNANSTTSTSIGQTTSTSTGATTTTTVVPGSGPVPNCTASGSGVITGTAGDDVICGSDDPDVISALGGNDIVFGRGGDDIIAGGDGNDLIVADVGDDLVAGGDGDDRIHAGNGDDLVAGGDGDDRINGGHGRDRCGGEDLKRCG